MLNLIRRYKGLFSIIFLAAAAGLIFSEMGGGPLGMMGDGISNNEVVAKVDGEEIQTRELVTLLNRELERMDSIMNQQGAQDPQQAQMIRQIMMSQFSAQQVLQRLIYQRFIYSTALDVGIRGAPETIREMIVNIPDFQNEGRFDPLRYRQMVARPALFEADLRRQVASEALQRSFEASLRVLSSQEIKNQKWLNRKITFETITVSPDNIAEIKKPTSAELEDFSKQADTEARLQSYYNRNISEYRTEEEVRARHILIREGSDKDVKAILEEIRSGSISFEEAAKKYSEDTSNASRGGDLDFFGRGMMVPEFEKVAFEMKNPLDISEPVKTQFGQHLIQLVERKEASGSSLDEVRGEILPIVWLEDQKQKKLSELVDTWLASENGPAQRELSRHQLKWEQHEAWTPSEPTFAPIGNVEEHMESLLSLSETKTFLRKAIPRGESFVLLRFVKAENAEDSDQPDHVLFAGEKVSQAYEYFFRERYEDAEKNKKIIISQDRVARIQQSIQEQFQ